MPKQSKPNSKKQRGAPDPVRVLVAIDVQEAGGLHAFDKENTFALDEILSNKEGERKQLYKLCRKGTDERRQVRNLVQRWKGKCSNEEFVEEVVVPLVVAKESEQANGQSQATEKVSCR